MPKQLGTIVVLAFQKEVVACYILAATQVLPTSTSFA